MLTTTAALQVHRQAVDRTPAAGKRCATGIKSGLLYLNKFFGDMGKTGWRFGISPVPRTGGSRAAVSEGMPPMGRQAHSGQAVLQALEDGVAGQVHADEHHARARGLVFPLGTDVAAHQLVNALEHHFAVHPLHI